MCAICAAGPLGLKTSQIARGDLTFAISLCVVLMVLNVALIPIWSSALIEQSIVSSPQSVLTQLTGLVLLPLGVGAFLRTRRHAVAGRVVPRLNAISSATLLVAVVSGLAFTAGQLWVAMASWTPIAAILVLGFAAGAGYLASLRDQSVRSVSTLITTNRATSIALLVVARSLSESPDAFNAVVMFGLLQTVATLGAAVILGRASASRQPPLSSSQSGSEPAPS